MEEFFAGERSRRKARLRMYALRKHSRRRFVEVSKRCGRTPAAVCLADRHLDDMARQDAGLALRLRELEQLLKRRG